MIYDYSFKRLNSSEEESLANYKGKVLLIVNTASKCVYTPQYEGLEALYKKFKNQGLVVLGFPSDSFLRQEFSEDEKIMSFCKVNYGVTFPLFSKSSMKGDDINPLFAELLKASGKSGLTWNFNKFLVGRDGRTGSFFNSSVTPEQLEEKIIPLL